MTPLSKVFHIVSILIFAVSLAAFSADWPSFHGPNRTNRSAETGLLQRWPEGGPRLLWTASGLGKGYSGATTWDGAVYTAGVVDRVHHVFAFNANTGSLLWKAQAGRSWEGRNAFARAFEGSRATPTVDPASSTVYYLTDVGLLVALDAKT
ncbi:MAG: hypothetical protein LBC70_09110, partial [Chitinispirillales bacterium]|nr:hypothetical protein [Chitinispirillales bacterium]